MAPDDRERMLRRLTTHPDRAGIFCDFDGTLASIVDDPTTSRPVTGAAEVLERLARRYRTVQVISGRPAAFLVSHLGGRGLELTGLYGLETARQGEVVARDDAAPWRSVVEEVAERAEDQLGDELLVEAKGLTLVLHWRTAPDQARGAIEWADREADRTGLVAQEGRCSYELRPPIPATKGTALLDAADGLAAACFLGDDTGDLSAFDALDQLARGGTATVRVAVRSPEAPSELLERADLVVDGPEGVVALLGSLLEADD